MLVVTTTYDASGHMDDEAKSLAERIGAGFAQRGRLSLERLREAHQASDVLVVGERELRLYADGGAQPFFFHPSMAAVRIKRLLAGEPDTMLEVTGVRDGDVVLDCTAGLASDAIVFAYAVGERGAVTALESEPLLQFLVETGLREYESDIPKLNAAMKRVRSIRADHAAYLEAQPDNSVDIVYFDPMFRRPIGESTHLSPLRQMANHEPIHAEVIAHAKRAARKAVVLKERQDSGEFARLGFSFTARAGSKFSYGVIRT